LASPGFGPRSTESLFTRVTVPSPVVARESTLIDTIDAIALEAEIDVPTDRWAAVVLAHPHPSFGGDMYSAVTQWLFDALPNEGIAAVRFNFRGVGRSGGDHDEGRGERLDVVAALELAAMFVEGPIILAGYSFGADVSLCVVHPTVAGWYAIAPPLRTAKTEMVAAGDVRPKRIAAAEHDQFTPFGAACERTADWANTQVEEIEGADHFLAGRLRVVADGCVAFARALAAS
jgi:alpha/beta superfamily hydrolase